MDAKDYQDSYFYLLAFEKNFRHFTQQRIADCELSLASLMILYYLDANGVCGQKELTVTFNASSAAMAAAITRLEERGLVQKTVDADDKRNNLIALSDDGREMLAQFTRRHSESIRRVTDNGFSREELAELKRLQTKLFHHLKAIADSV